MLHSVKRRHPSDIPGTVGRVWGGRVRADVTPEEDTRLMLEDESGCVGSGRGIRRWGVGWGGEDISKGLEGDAGGLVCSGLGQIQAAAGGLL